MNEESKRRTSEVEELIAEIPPGQREQAEAVSEFSTLMLTAVAGMWSEDMRDSISQIEDFWLLMDAAAVQRSAFAVVGTAVGEMNSTPNSEFSIAASFEAGSQSELLEAGRSMMTDIYDQVFEEGRALSESALTISELFRQTDPEDLRAVGAVASLHTLVGWTGRFGAAVPMIIPIMLEAQQLPWEK